MTSPAGTATGSVGVTVTAVAIPPAAAADTATVVQGGSVLIDVLANDTGTGLTLTAAATPAHGTAVIEAGKIRYTPTAGYVGADGFTYTVTSPTGTAAGSVGVTVRAATVEAPAAAADSATVAQGGSVLIDVLANDTGTGLTLTAAGAPLHGSAIIETGKIRYTAASDFVGADSLTYTVRDTAGQTASGTVALTINLTQGTAIVAPLAFSPALTVPENAGATAIGIAAPDDPAVAAGSLIVTLIALPANGIVTLSNGTPVTAGQTLTAAALTGLLFTPAPGLFGQRSALVYTVADPAGTTATGRATLTIGPAAGDPVVSARTLTVPPGAAATPVGLMPASDPNFAASALTLTVLSLPSNGIVALADGTALTGPGQVLTGGQLSGLTFRPTPGLANTISTLVYQAADPAGHTATGVVTLAVGPRVTATAPVLGFVPPAGGPAVVRAITNTGQPVFAGTSDALAAISLAGTAVTGQANGAGNFALPPLAVTAPVTGLRLSETALATVPGLAASAPGTPVELLILPGADASGYVRTNMSSLDIANALHAGFGLRLSAGTEAIILTDGVLSVGPDTAEAYLQRLYLGLLGRSYDAAGMEYWDRQLSQGMDRTAVATSFLGSAEYTSVPHATGAAAFITSLYASLLGRAPEAEGLAYWLSTPVQATGNAAIVRSFADMPEAKTRNAFATSKVFARDTAGTLLHNIYETALGREAELEGLAYWKSQLPFLSPAGIAAQIAAQPETLSRHAGQSDTQYIADLIQTGFGRAPTQAELGTTLGRMNNGLTRAALMLEIAAHPETVARWTSNDMNEPPALDALANVTVSENQPVTVSLSASDPDRTSVRYALVSGPAGSSVDPVTGRLTWTAPAAPLHADAVVSVTDPSGLSARRSFGLDVTPTAPVLSVSGPGTALAGTDTYVGLTASALTPGASVASWSINWGDGGAAQTVTNAAGTNAAGTVWASRTYAVPGTYQVTATALTNGYGSFAAAPVTITAGADSLAATSVTAETSGFHARFNGVLDPTSLTTRADGGANGPSVLVVGDVTGVVSGSIVADPDGAGFRFVADAAAGLARNTTYRTAITAAVRDKRGRALDGNADGTGGDDLSITLPARAGTGTLSVPALMRGPGQAVTGLPVTFASDGTVTDVVFTATFDPALLSLTGALAGAGLPAGSRIVLIPTPLADGRVQASISVHAPAPIAAGPVELVSLSGSVPASAAYGATEVLSLAVSSVNGIAQALPETAGSQVVGYVGDADGDGAYTAADRTRILRVVGGADTGFAAWRGVAPAVVADLDKDGAITAADAALVGTVSATLPAIPPGITLTFASATPFVSAPVTLSATAGGAVTVPVTLGQSLAVSGGRIDLRYDPAALDLTAVRADPASGLIVNAGAAANGLVSVTLAPGTGSGTASVLALFDFTVSGTARPGTALVLDLAAVTLNGRTLASRPGADGTDGRILTRPAAVPLSLTSAALIAHGMDDAFDPLSTDTASVNPARAARARLLGGTAA